TRGLVAMHLANLGETYRQLAIAAQAMLENLHVAGTIHGLNGVHALIGCLGEIHVLAEFLEMAGLAPQARVHELRRTHFLVTRRALPLAHVANQRLKDEPALGMPEDRSRRLLLQVKKVKLAPDPAVI